jgi:hypothetical protein
MEVPKFTKGGRHSKGPMKTQQANVKVVASILLGRGLSNEMETKRETYQQWWGNIEWWAYVLKGVEEEPSCISQG